jgi:uncharacterized membrane protein
MKYLEKTFLFRYYARRTDAGQVLILFSLFSLSLILFRVIYTGSPLFLFLVWNLFLALIPFLLSGWGEKNIAGKRGWKFGALLIVWLLFLPNAFYIITDLFHLDMNETVPLWYDLVLLLSFAWNGLLFGVVSVRQMEKLLEQQFNKRFGLLFLLPIMFLNGLGVYIGRYLRFNSWEILTNPFRLAADMVYLFIHPLRNRFDWSMIICYTVLLTLIYLTFKKLSKVL